MPTFEKSPPELVERFDAAAERSPRPSDARCSAIRRCSSAAISTRPVRPVVDDPPRRRRPNGAPVAAGAGPFEPMPGKPMKGYATLPTDVVDDDGQLDDWIRRAIDHGKTLPAK